MHDEVSALHDSHAAATEAFAVDGVGIHAVLALVVIVREVVHVVDDGRGLLLRPHIDALCRVGFCGQELGGVHTVGREVVLPSHILAGSRFDGGIGELRGCRGCAFGEGVASGLASCNCSLEADGCGAYRLEGNHIAVLVGEGTGGRVGAFGHSHLDSLARAVEAEAVAQAEGERLGSYGVGVFLLGDDDVVPSNDFLAAVIVVVRRERDCRGGLAVALEVKADLLPGLLVLHRRCCDGGTAFGDDADYGIAAQTALPQIHAEGVVPFGQHQLLTKRDGRCSPFLAHPIGLVAMCGGLGKVAEELVEIQVTRFECREVVLVGRGVADAPSIRYIDGAVGAHAAVLHCLVAALEVAVLQLCGQLVLAFSFGLDECLLSECLHCHGRGTGVIVGLIYERVLVFVAIGVGRSVFQSLDGYHLVHESVTVGGEHLPVVGQGENPHGELRRMVVAVRAGGACGPVVAGEQAVLAAVGVPADADDGIIVSIQAVLHVPDGEERPAVAVLVHDKGQVERLVLAEAEASYARVHALVLLGRQLLLPGVVAAYVCGIALGVVLVDHPVVVVSVHPGKPHL